MQNNFSPKRKKTPQKKGNNLPNNNWLFWLAMGLIFMFFMSQSQNIGTMSEPKTLTYSEFYNILKDNDQTGQITQLELIESTERILKGTLRDNSKFRLNIPTTDEGIIDLIRTNVPNFEVKPSQTFVGQIFLHLLPILIFLFFIFFIFSRGFQM